MKGKIPLDALSTGITDALVETATLREQCKSQQLEIKSLNDYKLESEIEMDCRVSDESLIAAKQDVEDLTAKQESSQQRVQSLEKEVLSYRRQIEKLIVALRNKTRKALVCSIALKSAYKIVPSLKDQATIQRLQSLSEMATSPRWVDKKVDMVLKEVGVVASTDEADDSLRTPALTPSTETSDDGERPHLKRKRHR
ncbi:hypothetical protein N0V84_002071 [Fusarium piperis]|uniref:Uncharacterized protein n=1 Tax=Fusarium piperis TaxID=1435070 RepID=A0A9W9BSQ8_9HYPO|nr:hypothetical protein N0V84_002071 [Fusarium piperis]